MKGIIAGSLLALGATATTADAGATTKKQCTGLCQESNEKYGSPRMYGIMEQKTLWWHREKEEGMIGVASSTGPSACVDGMAGEFPCSGIDLQSFVSLPDLGCGGQGSDIWGWTDAEGNEFAVAGCADGSSFIDVTDPVNPVVLGFLATTTDPSNWRDMKVYKNYVYIGSEALNHGMQCFDMTQLTTVAKAYRQSRDASITRNITAEGHVRLNNIFEPTYLYTEFGSSHNIVINEDSGFLYAVGTKTCRGGLHVVDLADPAAPEFVGCYDADGYTHDAECVIYSGPDTEFTGHEICFNYNEDTLTIVDVTHKDDMKLITRYGYEGAFYTHQGWLNAAQTHLVMDDEKDEQQYTVLDGHTRSMVWDVSKLDRPFIASNFYSTEQAIDHNQYWHQGMSYQSNYCAGLRILDASALGEKDMTELAYFDCSPECDTPVFSGTWSNFPYFTSGNVIMQSIERGLFVVRLQDNVKPSNIA